MAQQKSRHQSRACRLREISVCFCGRKCRYFSRTGIERGLPLPFVREEEEKLVPNDRAAYCPAKLIPFQDGYWKPLLVVEKTIGVEEVVPNVIVSGTVKLVCTAFCNDTDDAARISTILRTVIVFKQPELGHRVRIRICHNAVVEQIIVQPAVEEIGDRIGAHTSDAVVTLRCG